MSQTTQAPRTHHVVTFARNDGYAARCEHPHCNVATFGGFPTRTEAREAAARQHRADAERAAADEQRAAQTFAAMPWSDGNAHMLGFFQGMAEHKGPDYAGRWLLGVLEQREAAEAAR